MYDISCLKCSRHCGWDQFGIRITKISQSLTSDVSLFSTCKKIFYCKCCYDRALLPLIIYLSRLRIASNNIFNLWQLRQGVDSLAQWLEHWIFNREDRVRFPGKTEYFFSYASFLCYGYHVIRWGLIRNWTLLSRKWLHVIINDDFLEKGECYDRALLPSIICLSRLRIASNCIFNLWQLCQGVDSLAQWLEHWIFNREDRVRFPGKTEYFFSYASFLCYGYHVVRMF